MSAGRHHAHVFAFSAHPQDERLTLRVECHGCPGEVLGEGVDSRAELDRLQALAAEHNRTAGR